MYKKHGQHHGRVFYLYDMSIKYLEKFYGKYKSLHHVLRTRNYSNNYCTLASERHPLC